MTQYCRNIYWSALLIIPITMTIAACNGIRKSGTGALTGTNKLCFQSYCPTGAPKTNFIVDHTIYVLSSNRRTKFSDWVAYRVDKANLHGPRRRRNWKRDPAIPAAYTLLPKDYKGAHAACGYDRGHQAPLASFSNNPNWRNTNYLSNITPQKSSLNQGPWVRLESSIRRLAEKGRAVYVITGPIYNNHIRMCSLPARPLLKIPSAYFKVIFQSGSNVFVMQHSSCLKK